LLSFTSSSSTPLFNLLLLLYLLLTVRVNILPCPAHLVWPPDTAVYCTIFLLNFIRKF
jgi:hypothetical protein